MPVDLIPTLRLLELTPPPTLRLKELTRFQPSARSLSLTQKARQLPSMVRILTEFSKDPAPRLSIPEPRRLIHVLVQKLLPTLSLDQAERHQSTRGSRGRTQSPTPQR